MAEIAESYLTDRDRRAADPARLRYAWQALAPVFGGLRPDQVDRARCRAYAARRRRQGRADGTIGRELSVLRAALRHADPNSPARIELPPAPAPRDRHLSRPEFERLAAAAQASGPHLALFVELALGTAGRQAALLALRWEAVDFLRGRIDLGAAVTRGGKRRAVVPMTGRLRAALEQARAAAVTESVIEYAGRRVRSVKRGFAAASRRAGLDDVTPHVLRHTAAVWMAEAGVPIEEIAQYLGHSDPRITYRVYARFSPDHLRRAASALE